MKTFFIIISLFSYLQGFSQMDQQGNKEILWDTWGVPHIYANNESDIYYSFGWAQMESHGDLIMKLYGEARGKAAEYWGEDYLDNDLKINQLNLPKLAEKGLRNIPEKQLSLLRSFTKGLNDYALAHPEKLSKKYRMVLPLKPYDIVAHSYRLFYLEFLIRWSVGDNMDWVPGSNGWAIGPSKTSTGDAMLLANPHLPWFDFWKFYEAHLNLGNQTLYGATLVGIPFIAIGFNNNLGWTHTVNTLDNVDLFRVKVKNGKYLINDHFEPFNTRSKILKTRKEEDAYRIDTLEVKETKYGIVLKEKSDVALVVRFAKMNSAPNILDQWYKMGKARSLESFQDALRLNELPLFNVLYADKTGNIFYYFGGQVPRKSVHNSSYWDGIVNGNNSQDIWNSYYSFNSLPKLLNPKSGWLQNANDPPFTCTIPTELDPKNYPGEITGNHMFLRPQKSAKLLLNDDKISFSEMIEYKHSTSMELADRILDDLLALKNETNDSLILESMNVLKKWDKQLNSDSEGAVLFIEWANRISGADLNRIFKTPWTFGKPITTPDGLANTEKALSCLKESAKAIFKRYGKLDIEYGKVYRVKVGDFEFPANGGRDSYGVFRTLRFTPAENGKKYAFHGDSFVAAIDFGENITAKVLLSYGNSSQSGNPHLGDQLELFSEKKLRNAWIKRAEIEEHIEKIEKL